MLTRERVEETFRKVLKYSTADETEAIISWTSYSLTRFANNTIHQNVAEETSGISVRAVVEGRMARASTNRTDEASIRQACEGALTLARLRPPDTDLLRMQGASTYRSVERLDDETRELSPFKRAETICKVIERAEKDGLTAAGVFSSGMAGSAIFNSRGVRAIHEETIAEFSVTMLGESSSGWAKKTSPRWSELETDLLADRAARKALESRDPREIPPGKYTVILEPAAVLDLLGFLVLDFVGQKLFGENVSIKDDVYHPLQSGAPFDGEGAPRRRVALVERGVVKNLVYSRQTADKVGAEPTGHGFPLPNEYGEAPVNIVMEGEKSTMEDMIRTTPRGLLVTRLWYIREVDRYQKILTGMTRDGTFWIEDGKLQYGIKNLRFNQSILEMLAQVEMMGVAQRASGEESFDMVVP